MTKPKLPAEAKSRKRGPLDSTKSSTTTSQHGQKPNGTSSRQARTRKQELRDVKQVRTVDMESSLMHTDTVFDEPSPTPTTKASPSSSSTPIPPFSKQTPRHCSRLENRQYEIHVHRVSADPSTSTEVDRRHRRQLRF